MSTYSQEEVWAETPPELLEFINQPPTPFEELQPYDEAEGLYELDGRQGEQGKYRVELLMKKIGEETFVLTRVETQTDSNLFEVVTPTDNARDQLYHVFPSAPQQKVGELFPKAA